MAYRFILPFGKKELISFLRNSVSCVSLDRSITRHGITTCNVFNYDIFKVAQRDECQVCPLFQVCEKELLSG